MSDPQKLTFREQIKESNQKFKNEMKVANAKFKTDIKNQKTLNSKDRQLLNNFGVILLLIFVFPVGLFVMFRKTNWSKRSKIIATCVGCFFILMIALIIVNAPPTVTLANLKPTDNKSVAGENITLTGSVYPADSIMLVDGKSVNIDDQGKFSYVVSLKEGDNDIIIITKKGDKRSTSVYKVHRYTRSEIIAQEKAAAKKKADEATATQVKLQQAADAKAKADADAAAKAAKDKADAEASAKAKALAAATVSQKNALSKAKSYLSYTAFSHDGLIDQLEYEQFSTADATYGADNSGADWYAQAAAKAISYMNYSSFSRGSLIDQLEYDKFTPDQAAHGANSVGL